MSFIRRSLLLKLLLLASLILTIIFAATGYLLERRISAQTSRTVEAEVQGSFQAYESLWYERTLRLRQISKVVSRMADVRAAFLTKDAATIQDTAGELQNYISSTHTFFAVTDGGGKVIACAGGLAVFHPKQDLPFIETLISQFPQQASGLLEQNGRLFQIVITPVYVEGTNGQNLLNTLVTGFEIDSSFLSSLKQASGGSDFVFQSKPRTIVSTLTEKTNLGKLSASCSPTEPPQQTSRLRVGSVDYLAIGRTLPGINPSSAGNLCILRSLATAERGLQDLRKTVLLLWLSALVAAIICTYALARSMLRPIAELDRAATEIAGGHYGVQVPAKNDDELGRLASSFNKMSSSLESARAELIRHERLAAVARLATSVVHDLRNPLASIYAGAEMLAEEDLPVTQIKRLARNMHQASRGLLKVLQELLDASRKEPGHKELCLLHDLVEEAWKPWNAQAENCRITFSMDVPSDLGVFVEASPIERVFSNLFENALQAIGLDGKVQVTATLAGKDVELHIDDTGHGISPALQAVLFQPFVSEGKQNGLGLGLTLSRQTVRAHGGNLWMDAAYTGGTRFCLRLPIVKSGTH
ncbi:MAG: HAMP domain-containing histidine kinase [Acidobacteriaceae bacterium]|nr:HAMP domain-containing histidine kinase [Acidobacteriaceae bacterium]MBV9937872.1 HAMP domain-containing histidine kinase [Acidobacteriaceae bacterium]